MFKFSTIEFEYVINNNADIDKKSQEMEAVVAKIIQENITADMTDFQKELALHDVLVSKVNYYKYEDINAIPAIKHTAYGALVENEAVCDGYSKAFVLLLERAGIDSIIISGVTGNVAHAWNVVNIDNEYYHVDVTSNSLDQNGNKYVIHKYFNITDKEIKQTHAINKDFEIPLCDSENNDYYKRIGYYLNYEDNLYTKLKKIISKQKSSPILEVKADDRYYSKNIIDTLYDLNFNNWYTSAKTSVSYNKIENVYVFVK